MSTHPFAVAIGVAAALFAPLLPAAAPPYRADPTHTDVLFAIDHLGFSTKHGAFRAVSATLNYDAAKPQDSKVSVAIKANSIDTANAERDADLKSDGFFDVAKFPEIRFVSTKMTATGGNSFTVDGTLTMHGIARPLQLQVKLNHHGASPMTNKDTVGFSGSGTLKRSAFGITQYLPAIGDDVVITIDIEFSP